MPERSLKKTRRNAYSEVLEQTYAPIERDVIRIMRYSNTLIRVFQIESLIAHIFDLCNMKFKRLTLEELEALKDEFVQFLSSNSITADEWTRLKEKAPEKANRLIDLFSDIVWEKIIGKTEYLEILRKNGIQLFYFGETMAEMIQVSSKSEKYDFRESDTFLNLTKKEISIHTGKKAYTKGKSQEVFSLLSKGAIPIDANKWERYSKRFISKK